MQSKRARKHPLLDRRTLIYRAAQGAPPHPKDESYVNMTTAEKADFNLLLLRAKDSGERDERGIPKKDDILQGVMGMLSHQIALKKLKKVLKASLKKDSDADAFLDLGAPLSPLKTQRSGPHSFFCAMKDLG